MEIQETYNPPTDQKWPWTILNTVCVDCWVDSCSSIKPFSRLKKLKYGLEKLCINRWPMSVTVQQSNCTVLYECMSGYVLLQLVPFRKYAELLISQTPYITLKLSVNGFTQWLSSHLLSSYLLSWTLSLNRSSRRSKEPCTSSLWARAHPRVYMTPAGTTSTSGTPSLYLR